MFYYKKILMVIYYFLESHNKIIDYCMLLFRNHGHILVHLHSKVMIINIYIACIYLIQHYVY